MLTTRHFALLGALLIAPLAEAFTQTPPFIAPPRRIPAGTPLIPDDDRSGPRLGVAYLIGGSVAAENSGQHVAPIMSLFGWQVEHQFHTGNPALPLPVTELVAVVGGIEQGAFLPSASWIVGLRQPNGWEAGIGPSLTGAGVQLVAAVGVTRALGGVNVPINFAVAPGRRGAAISVTTGFNVQRGW